MGNIWNYLRNRPSFYKMWLRSLASVDSPSIFVAMNPCRPCWITCANFLKSFVIFSSKWSNSGEQRESGWVLQTVSVLFSQALQWTTADHISACDVLHHCVLDGGIKQERGFPQPTFVVVVNSHCRTGNMSESLRVMKIQINMKYQWYGDPW